MNKTKSEKNTTMATETRYFRQLADQNGVRLPERAATAKLADTDVQKMIKAFKANLDAWVKTAPTVSVSIFNADVAETWKLSHNPMTADKETDSGRAILAYFADVADVLTDGNLWKSLKTFYGFKGEGDQRGSTFIYAAVAKKELLARKKVAA